MWAQSKSCHKLNSMKNSKSIVASPWRRYINSVQIFNDINKFLISIGILTIVGYAHRKKWICDTWYLQAFPMSIFPLSTCELYIFALYIWVRSVYYFLLWVDWYNFVCECRYTLISRKKRHISTSITHGTITF